MPSTFATVIAGATVVVPVAVSNTASVVHPLGTDALVATVSGSAGLVGSQTVTAALAPSSTTVNLQVNTAAAAAINASALITTAVEGAQNASLTRTIAGTVLAAAIFIFMRSEAWDRLADRLRFRLPVLGRVARLAFVAVACRTLATLLASGIHLLDAIATDLAALGGRVLPRT